MSGTCSTYGGTEESIENLVEKPEKLRAVWRIILKWILNKQGANLWTAIIRLRWIVENMITKLRFP
jgi:hypothetical protein